MATEMTNTLTYQLNDSEGKSYEFYDKLRSITSEIIDYNDSSIQLLIAEIINNSSDFKNKRTKNEYLFELLMLGVFKVNYQDTISNTGWFKLKLLKLLYSIRSSNRRLKPSVDFLRGKLMATLVPNHKKQEKETFTLNTFKKLILFLQATGDYKEEAVRLKDWEILLKSMTSEEMETFEISIEAFVQRFQLRARSVLGEYTLNVNHFINSNRDDYKDREDRLLCLRQENEYHLNMIGAEIMNEALRPEYLKTNNKVVLLPTCMRGVTDKECKATHSGLVRECIGCRIDCNIGMIKQILKKETQALFLVPHSSDFSRFLKKWQGQKDTALVGVACVPNLIMGGYEMQSLGIPSQCVFLNYCGCQKHWSPDKAIATNLDLNRLYYILNQ